MARTILNVLKSKTHMHIRPVKKNLLEAWPSLHRGVASSKLAQLPSAGNQVTVCSRIGMCVCLRNNARLRAVVKNVQSVMQRRVFVKDSSMRQFFDFGALLVSIHGEEGQQTHIWWLHLSYANMRTLHMTVVPMDHLPAGPDA